MTPVAGTVIAERFRLVRPLGQGGMGSVWLADHVGLDIHCALKFILGEGKNSLETRSRFEREAKIAAQIRSPHVVHLLDHGVWEEVPYIAMEYLEGEDLDSRLERVRRLSTIETATITAQVARALTKAHGAGLVHRDLKPANIFLTRDDDREIVKVLDFGIAKDSTPRMGGGESTTKTGSILGTPAYMSPEQAQGVKRVDHRSDLWSLGVVVFECLTGQLPFQSEAFGDLLLKIMVEPLPVPSKIALVPARFDAWWARAAARDPADRFQSAREMSDALAYALGISTSEISAVRISLTDPFMTGPLSQQSLLEITPMPHAAPSAGDAVTLAAPEGDSGLREAPASQGHQPGVDGRGTDPGLAPGQRPRLQTAGPVSTSLPQAPAPARQGAGRFILAVLAGSFVAGIGAMLILRGMGHQETAPAAGPEPPATVAEPVNPAPPIAAAAPDTAAPVVAPAQTAAPVATASPTQSAVAVPPTAPPSTAPTSAGTRPQKPPGTKKPGPNDFGI